MLTAQAHTLDALFSDLTRLAYQNLNNFDAGDRLFRLAFKAQGQARARQSRHWAHLRTRLWCLPSKQM
jgi:hypothetical protein